MKILLTLLTAVLIMLSCSEIAEPGSDQEFKAKLIDGFFSYSMPLEVTTSFPPSTEITILENSKHPTRRACPRFDVFSISASRWSHLGVSGTLELNFVNEALYRTSFYPEDMQTYLDKLKATGLEVSSETMEVTEGRALIRYATNWKNQNYVAWTDQKINEELRTWIRSCA